jgi:hypothetical protein
MIPIAQPRLLSRLERSSAKRILLAVLVVGQISLEPLRSAAQLSPGTTQYKPGTTPALGPPNYSTTLPSYFTPGNQVDSMSSTLIGAGGVTLTSTVFRDPGSSFLGFEYSLSIGNPTPNPITGLVLDTGSHPWQGIGITLAGADASGHSTASSGTPSWTDGAPIFLFRDTVANGSSVTIQFQNADEGTALNGGDLSAQVFFATDATSYGSATFQVLPTLQGTPDGFAPVPEPSVVALVTVAGALIGIRFRLRKATSRLGVLQGR